jgi:hypothetical protein
VCADLANDHSARFMLTCQQLQRAIRSGGFLVAPHRGRYDLAVTATTHPYTPDERFDAITLNYVIKYLTYPVAKVLAGR